MSVIVEAMAQVTDDLSFVENATALSEMPESDGNGKHETNAAQRPTLLPVLTRSTLPPDWQTRIPVLCVSGRSPLDAAASALMDHLLEIHGIPCAQLSFADFSATKVKALNMTDVHVIILSYVSLGNRTAHIRSLIRRVRRVNPDTVIIAGVWDNIEHDGKEVAELDIGADHTINSLHAGLELCINYALNQQANKANVAAAPTA